MIIYKLAGAALLILSGGLAGRAVCQRGDAALEQTGAFISLIKYIRNQIDCYLMPVDKILASCPEGMLDSCRATDAAQLPPTPPGVPPRPPFAALLETCDMRVPPEIYELLERFAGELGSGYRDTQLKLCDHYIAKLGAEFDRMRAAEPARRKMVMTLCLCVSACVAVIIF